MIPTIETYKNQLNAAKDSNGDWRNPYENLMRELYNLPVLFFALSKDNYDAVTKTSVPLISTKDFNGSPTLYVFSDVDLASGWMSHYHHATEDLKYGFIGAIEKAQYDFNSVFQIAKVLGVQMIMLDEGGSLVGIDINYFMEVNSLSTDSINVPLTKEQYDEVVAAGKLPDIRFTPVSLIPLTSSHS